MSAVPLNAVLLDRAWIEAHIPHSGAMCLLDGVEAWDDTHIRCTATSHRDPHNPLRANARLGAACGIEYAAQAMAVHGALVGIGSGTNSGTSSDTGSGAGSSGESQRPRVGFLASVRGVEAHVTRLDTFTAPLTIEAERLNGDGTSVLYAFTVRCGAQTLLSGRAAVMLDASGRLPGGGATSKGEPA